MLTKDIKSLSIQDTNVIKGLALLFLLWHHLFYKNNGLFEDITIFGYGIANQLGVFSKICVAIFVFLSGYGLIKSTKSKPFNVVSFYWKRFIKLFSNYWFIWLIFIPINVFCFGNTFESVYQDYIVPKFFVDLAGLACLFGTRTMNATWWFYSCIIMLYALYPMIYGGGYRYIIIFIIALLLSFAPSFKFIEPIRYYLLPFVLGIMCGDNTLMIYKFKSGLGLFQRIQNFLIGNAKRVDVILLFVLFMVIAIFRNVTNYGQIIDSFLALLIYLIYLNININSKIKSLFAFLGRHSFNIFLFHSFIYYWFKTFIYSPKNPILVFLLLLIITVLLSIVLELVKNKIGYYKIQNRLLTSSK